MKQKYDASKNGEEIHSAPLNEVQANVTEQQTGRPRMDHVAMHEGQAGGRPRTMGGQRPH